MTAQPSERDDQGWAQAQTEQGRHSGLNPGLTGDASGPGVSITPSLAPSPFAFFSSAPNLILFILSIGVFVGFTVRFLYALGFVCVYLCAGVCGGHMNMCVHGGMEVRGTTWGIFLRSYPTLLLRCGLSGTWFFTTRLHCLAKETQDLASWLLFPKTKNTNMCPYIRLFCCFFLFFIDMSWGSNSGPHECILSHLSIFRSSSLLFVSYLGP